MKWNKGIFEGAMVALVTPLKNGKIDEKTLCKLLDFHLKAGTDVIIPCGTTGESATMSHEEHRRVMSLVVEYVGGRVPVICGAGSNNTEEAIGLVLHAQKIGADGVLVVTPYYNKPTQEGLYRHYEFLAKKSEIPIVLYNVPGRTGVSLQPQTVARLSKIPNITAIKEASGSLEQVDQILNACDIRVLSGDDSLTLPMMSLGARGVISVTANIVPGLVRDMVHAALEGRWENAREIHRRLHGISKVLFIETNPIPVKTALGLMGKIKTEFRLPLCEMNPENQKKLSQALKDLGVIS
jgi:4-hydroxy-tetrahydrodipicolinate synthase